MAAKSVSGLPDLQTEGGESRENKGVRLSLTAVSH